MQELIKQLKQQHLAACILIDDHGQIIYLDEIAAGFMGVKKDKAIGTEIVSFLAQQNFQHKRLLVQSLKKVRLAQAGIPQQFKWIETKAGKPTRALNIYLNQLTRENKNLYLVQIVDILSSELIEWVLWSLAKINTHHDITAVIDEITQLACQVFDADHVLVNLIDSHDMAHSVSHYTQGEKGESVSFILEHSPCAKLLVSHQSACFDNLNPKDYPKDSLIKLLNPKSYVAGPLINSHDQVVGVLLLLSKEGLEFKAVQEKLFDLFLSRISLEIERLLYQRKLQFLASIPQQDPNPIIRILPSGEVIFANAQGKVMLNNWHEMHAGLPAKITADAQKARTSGQVVHSEISVNEHTYLLTMVWIPDFNQINIYGTDISQLKAAEQDILNLARYDALTQIANRQYFEERLLKTLHDHHTGHQKLALLLIDLDNFKIINDTLGHPIGDRLLQAATKRMERCLRQDDFLARLGGDEFIVMLNRTDADAATIVADKLNHVLSKPFQFGEYRMEITCSIGIAIFPDSGLNASDLLRHADIAMYQAKKSGKDRYTLFSNQLHYVQHQRHNIIKKDLKHAAARNQLALEYQPQFNLADGKIIGFEALLRWNHPEQGLIYPAEFIPLAEQTGTISTIGQWAIEQAISDFTRYILPLHPQSKLSLNVSLMQISDARFLDTLCDSLAAYALNNDYLILDVSEHVMATSMKEIYKALDDIHARGIKISLDNFGGPHVSLSKLLDLPIDYIKLDQRLLYGMEDHEKQKQLLAGILELANKLNLQVIQKGIENTEQSDILKSLGYELVQGYHYCQPVDIAELQKFLKSYNPANKKSVKS